jgi:hypothetical protein
MITYEELEVLAAKVDQGTATEIEELLFLETLNRGLDELIAVVDEQESDADDAQLAS